MDKLALLLAGYSVFYALVFSLTHFRNEHDNGQRLRQLTGLLLILTLATMQLAHFFYLLDSDAFALVHSRFYSALLFIVGPAFYLYAMPLLKAQDTIKPVQFLQFSPIMLVFVLSYEASFLLAFMLGGLYLLWLARSVYALRQQRGRFRWELSLLVTIFILAVLVLFLGLLFPLVSQRLFFTFYTCAIGLAFLFIHIVLASTPQLSIEVVEAARETYAKSTLTNIDTDQCLQKLNTLMQERKLFQENNLDLFTLATELELSSHQLSELMNSCLGKSFSRFIREQRVEAAKKRLHEAPKMSVLSVGLSVGFTSQSNFYEAFREIVGTSPAKYRKL